MPALSGVWVFEVLRDQGNTEKAGHSSKDELHRHRIAFRAPLPVEGFTPGTALSKKR